MTSNNIYIDKIIELCSDNEQTAEYISIVSNARIRASTKKEADVILGYAEEHHILPRSFKMGGVTDKLNYAYLSAREHYRCHQLLIEMGLTRNLHAKMIHAFGRLCTDGKHKFINEEEYEELKISISAYHHMKNPECVQKCRNTHFEKTGYTHYMKDPKRIQTRQDIVFEKTGFTSNLANPKLREQYSQSYFEETGYTHNMKNPECIQKRKDTCFERTGYYTPSQTPECIQKGKDTNFKKTGYISNMQTPECKEIRKHILEIKFTRPLVLQILDDIEKYNVTNPSKIMGINNSNWKQVDDEKLEEGSVKFYKYLDERKIEIKEYEYRINEISSVFKSIDDKRSLISYIKEIKDFYNITNYTGIMEVDRKWKRGLNVLELQIALEKLLKHTVDKFYMN
jgi:hypothetical protein